MPGGAFHVSPSECDASVWKARRRARRCERRRCLTTDGPGRTAVPQHRGAPSAGVAWCNGQRTHATPTARRTRCSVAPPAHHTRGYSSMVRASGCRPEGCGFESRWSRSHTDVHAELRPKVRSAEGRSNHKGLPAELRPKVRSAGGRSNHSVALLRARGAALTSRRRCEVQVTAPAVVAQRIESTSLRTRGAGVRISPAALA